MTAPNTTAPNVVAKWPTWAPYLLSLLRIVAAFLFMQFGTAKLFAFPAAIFTRPVAFILAGEMAVAYFMGHAPQGFWPVLNQGAPAILFCFIWLYFSAAGPGLWSLDAKRGK